MELNYNQSFSLLVTTVKIDWMKQIFFFEDLLRKARFQDTSLRLLISHYPIISLQQFQYPEEFHIITIFEHVQDYESLHIFAYIIL